MSPVRFILGKRFKKFRKERGWSQQDLADMLELQKASISNYEIGKQAMSIDTLYILADILGLEIAEILPTKKEMKEWGDLMEKIL